MCPSLFCLLSLSSYKLVYRLFDILSYKFVYIGWFILVFPLVCRSFDFHLFFPLLSISCCLFVFPSFVLPHICPSVVFPWICLVRLKLHFVSTPKGAIHVRAVQRDYSFRSRLEIDRIIARIPITDGIRDRSNYSSNPDY